MDQNILGEYFIWCLNQLKKLHSISKKNSCILLLCKFKCNKKYLPIFLIYLNDHINGCTNINYHCNY